MDPINPWIDPNETRRMAERLMLPPREPVQAPEDTGFDESFVGFSDPVVALIEPENTSPIQEEAATEVTSIEAVEAPAEDEVQAYAVHRAMLRDQFGAIGAFLVAGDGSSFFNEGDYGAFRFIGRELASNGAKPDHVRVKVGAAEVLELIPIHGESGSACLGVVFPNPLPPESVGQIRLHWLACE